MSVPGDLSDGQQRSTQRYGPATRPRNGFGVAALVLGILALLLSWTIIGGVLLGALALIFGVLGGVEPSGVRRPTVAYRWPASCLGSSESSSRSR
jgi:hypothetical protein